MSLLSDWHGALIGVRFNLWICMHSPRRCFRLSAEQWAHCIAGEWTKLTRLRWLKWRREKIGLCTVQYVRLMSSPMHLCWLSVTDRVQHSNSRMDFTHFSERNKSKRTEHCRIRNNVRILIKSAHDFQFPFHRAVCGVHIYATCARASLGKQPRSMRNRKLAFNRRRKEKKNRLLNAKWWLKVPFLISLSLSLSLSLPLSLALSLSCSIFFWSLRMTVDYFRCQRLTSDSGKASWNRIQFVSKLHFRHLKVA